MKGVWILQVLVTAGAKAYTGLKGESETQTKVRKTLSHSKAYRASVQTPQPASLGEDKPQGPLLEVTAP